MVGPLGFSVFFLSLLFFASALPAEDRLQTGKNGVGGDEVHANMRSLELPTRHVVAQDEHPVFPINDPNSDLSVVPLKAFLVQELVWISTFMDFNDANFKLSGALPWFEKWTTDNRGKFVELGNQHGVNKPTLADFFLMEFFGHKEFGDKLGACSIDNCGCKGVPNLWTIVDRYKENPVKARCIYFTLRMLDFHFKNSCVLGKILGTTRAEIQGVCPKFAEVFAHRTKEEPNLCLILVLTVLGSLVIALIPEIFTVGTLDSVISKSADFFTAEGFRELRNLIERANPPLQRNAMLEGLETLVGKGASRSEGRNVPKLMAIFGNLTASALSNFSRQYPKRAVEDALPIYIPSLPGPDQANLLGSRALSGLDSFASIGGGIWRTTFGLGLHQVPGESLLFAGLNVLNPDAAADSNELLLASSVDTRSSIGHNGLPASQSMIEGLGIVLLPTNPQADVAGPSLLDLTYHKIVVDTFHPEVDRAIEELADPNEHQKHVQDGRVRVPSGIAKWIDALKHFQQSSGPERRKRSINAHEQWAALPVAVTLNNLEGVLTQEEVELITTASAFLKAIRQATGIQDRLKGSNTTSATPPTESFEIHPKSEQQATAHLAMPQLKLWEALKLDVDRSEATHFIQYEHSQLVGLVKDSSAIRAALIKSAKRSTEQAGLMAEYVGLATIRETGRKRANSQIEIIDAHPDHPDSLAFTMKMNHPVIKNFFEHDTCHRGHYANAIPYNTFSCELTVAQIVKTVTDVVFAKAMSLTDATTLAFWKEGSPAPLAAQFSKLFGYIPNMKKVLDMEENPGKFNGGIRQKLLSQLVAKAWTDQGCYLNCAPPNKHAPKCGSGEAWCPPGNSKICQPSCWDGNQQKDVLPYGWNEAQSASWNLSLDNVQELSWKLDRNEYRDWRPGNIGMFFLEENGFQRVPTMSVCNSDYNLVYKLKKNGADHYHEKKSFPCSCGGRYGDKSKQIWEMAGLTHGVKDPQQVHNCDEVLRPVLKTDVMAYTINMCNVFFHVAFEPVKPIKSEPERIRKQTKELPSEWYELDIPQKREAPEGLQAFHTTRTVTSFVRLLSGRFVRRNAEPAPVPKQKWKENMDAGRDFCDRIRTTLEKGRSLGVPQEGLSEAACWRWKEKTLRKKPCLPGAHKQCDFDLISHRIYHACGKCHHDKCAKPSWAT